MDKIFIADLCIDALIGIYPEERIKKQPIFLDIEVMVNTHPAAISDQIQDAVNYENIINRIKTWVQNSEFHLVEKLANHLAENLLLEFPIQTVWLKLSKTPKNLPVSRVGVVIERTRTL